MISELCKKNKINKFSQKCGDLFFMGIYYDESFNY